jgi:hypothetical protein
MSELPDSERRCNWTVAQVKDLQAERDRAQADAEQTRLAVAIYGEGIDPNGYYAGTPGSRVRELLAAEAERDALAARLAQAERVVEAARAWVNFRPGTVPWRVRFAQVEELIAAVDALDAGRDSSEPTGRDR